MSPPFRPPGYAVDKIWRVRRGFLAVLGQTPYNEQPYCFPGSSFTKLPYTYTYSYMRIIGETCLKYERLKCLGCLHSNVRIGHPNDLTQMIQFLLLHGADWTLFVYSAKLFIRLCNGAIFGDHQNRGQTGEKRNFFYFSQDSEYLFKITWLLVHLLYSHVFMQAKWIV